MSATNWTPERIAAYIRDFAPAVTAEMDRIEQEMRQVVPTCSIHRHLYDAAYLLRFPKLLAPPNTETILGVVQMRTVSGDVYTAAVWASWETGAVRVTGWPLPPGTVGLP